MKPYVKLAARPQDADIYSFNASKSVAAAEIVASTMKSSNPFADYTVDAPLLPPPTGSVRPSTGARPLTSMRGAGYSSKATSGANQSAAFDPLGLAATTPAPPLLTKTNSTPESQCKDLEKQIHTLIESTAFRHREGNHSAALERAKEGAKKDRALTKLRDKYSLNDSANHDLTYSVLLSLANAYHQCQMFDESLNTYAIIVKNRNYPQSSRLRVNMGNIYYTQGNYLQAIKQYRMCMDSLGNAFKEMKMRIQRNIGVCFLKTGQYQDAIHTFEAIMDYNYNNPSSNGGTGATSAVTQALSMPSGDVQSGFDLIVCYYALGDKEKMKKGFLQLLQTPELQSLNEEEEEEESANGHDGETGDEGNNDNGGSGHESHHQHDSVEGQDSHSHHSALPLTDSLSLNRRARRRHLQRYLLLAARLIAPHIEVNSSHGYDWIIELLRKPKMAHFADSGTTAVNARRASGNDSSTLSQSHMFDELNATKPGFPVTAMHLLLAKGINYIHSNDLSSAIQVFRSFHHTYSLTNTHTGAHPHGHGESKASNDSARDHLIDHAATNLSFLYFLEHDYQNASQYADLAVKHDRYNAKALVNKANILFAAGDYDGAKELYLESIGVEADCCEAIYNLGLVNNRLGLYNDSLQAFRKLNKLSPYDREVLYHLGALHEKLGQLDEGIHYYHTLHSSLPEDPALLTKLGSLYSSLNDETAAFHCYHDSYELFPLSMPVLSWLGVWYVKNEMFDEAIKYFEYADLIDTNASASNQCKWKLMIASCHRRLGDRNKAAKLYEAILKIDGENIEAIKYLMAIAKENGNNQQIEYWKNKLNKLEKNSKTQPPSQSVEPQLAAVKMTGTSAPVAPVAPSDEFDGANDVRPPASSPHISPRRAAKPDTSFKHDLGPEQVRKTVNSGNTVNEDEWGDDALADDLLPL